MPNETIISTLENNGIKATPNRILVLRSIMLSGRPLSLKDLETELQTLEKSSIFRVLSLLTENHILHTIEDGSGIVRYEICNARHVDIEDDIHAHFYCEKCLKVYCLDSIHPSKVTLPDGFTTRSINYVFKGICPDCQTMA